MDQREIQFFLESALLAAGKPLSADQLQGLFDGRSAPKKAEIRKAIDALNEEYEQRGIEIADVASGYRMQIKASMADRLQKLWEERPPRYSRALFETLALVAYRQPITRGEIEEIRGVAVSSNIVRTLMEREWIRVVGNRDVPGRPAMFGTTKSFLDYFGLKKLDDLPELSDLADWENLRIQLDLPAVENDGERAPIVAAIPPSAEELEDEAEEAAPQADSEEAGEEVASEQGGNEAATGQNAETADAEVDEDGNEDNTAGGKEEEELVVSEWPDPAETGSG